MKTIGFPLFLGLVSAGFNIAGCGDEQDLGLERSEEFATTDNAIEDALTVDKYRTILESVSLKPHQTKVITFPMEYLSQGFYTVMAYSTAAEIQLNAGSCASTATLARCIDVFNSGANNEIVYIRNLGTKKTKVTVYILKQIGRGL